GDSKVMWTFRRSIPSSYSIVSVQAPTPDPIGGFSWWLVNEAQRGASSQKGMAESACNASMVISSFYEKFCSLHMLSPSKSLALGFSQGAGLLSVLAQTHPRLFQKIGLLAGFVVALDKTSVPSHSKPDIFIAHGIKDTHISIQQAYNGRNFLEKNGYQVLFFEEGVGHKVGSQGMRQLGKWLKE
ncbi:MAG: hypothetical protein DCC75_05520, partial [Proteobacteria bacterium]